MEILFFQGDFFYFFYYFSFLPLYIVYYGRVAVSDERVLAYYV